MCRVCIVTSYNKKYEKNDNGEWKLLFDKKWFLFILFLLIYISFSFEVIIKPFIFAEDTIFLNDALDNGLKSIFFRHAGYLEVISRLTGISSIMIGKLTNSYWIVTAGMRSISIFLGAYYLSYFFLEDFSWVIKKRFFRFCVSVCLLIWMGNFYNLYYNITCIHWYEVVYVFFVGLNMLYGKGPKIKDCILVILGCLDAPESCLIVIPLLIFITFYWKKGKVRIYHWITLFSSLLCSLIQVYLLKNSESSGQLGGVLSIHTIVILCKQTIRLVAEAPCFILSNNIVTLLPTVLRISIGIVIWITLFLIMKKREFALNIFFYTLFFISAHFAICSVKYDLTERDRNYWEFSSSATIATFLCIVVLSWTYQDLKNKTYVYIIPVFLVLIGVSEINTAAKIDGLGEHYKTYDYEMLGMDLISNIENKVDFSSTEFENISLYAGWNLKVPVKK